MPSPSHKEASSRTRNSAFPVVSGRQKYFFSRFAITPARSVQDNTNLERAHAFASTKHAPGNCFDCKNLFLHMGNSLLLLEKKTSWCQCAEAGRLASGRDSHFLGQYKVECYRYTSRSCGEPQPSRMDCGVTKAFVWIKGFSTQIKVSVPPKTRANFVSSGLQPP